MSDVSLPICFGPTPVDTDARTVQAFAASLHPDGELTSSSRVPHTFPISWLLQPQIVDTLKLICPAGSVLVQSFQTFKYSRPLELHARFTLDVELSKSKKSGSDLWLDAIVRRPGGELVLEMQVALLTIRGFEGASA